MAVAKLSQGVLDVVSSPIPCWEGPVLSTDYSRSPVCHVDCPGCPESDPAPGPDSVPLAGWSLAGTAVLTFLVPLLFALTGAVVLRSSPAGQLVGCVAGLIIGMVIVRLLVPVSSRREGEAE